jgi:DNA-binding phage protein
MARPQTARSRRRARDELTVSHRERLVEELLADPKLAAEYLLAATEDSDHRVYFTAVRTVTGLPELAQNQLLLARNRT